MTLSIDLEAYRTAYNQLPDDVDGCYEQLLKRSSRDSVVGGAIRIIKSHRAHTYLGVALLHRHFTCGPGQIFVERSVVPQAPGHPMILITAPVAAADVFYDITPHRLAFDGGGTMVPLEFTADQRVAEGYDKAMRNRAMISELGDYLAANRLSKLLGVGIFKRDGVLDHSTRVFVEKTETDENQSVVHVMPKMAKAVDRLVPTLWTYARRGSGGVAESASCAAYCSHGSKWGDGYCGHRRPIVVSAVIPVAAVRPVFAPGVAGVLPVFDIAPEPSVVKAARGKRHGKGKDTVRGKR